MRHISCSVVMVLMLFFFNVTASTGIYTYWQLFPYTTLFRSHQRFSRRRYGGVSRNRVGLWPRQPGGDGKDRPGNSRQHGLRQSRGLPCQHAVAGADPDCAAREDDRRVREDQSRLLTAAPRSLADETAPSGGGFVVLVPQKCTFIHFSR